MPIREPSWLKRLAGTGGRALSPVPGSMVGRFFDLDEQLLLGRAGGVSDEVGGHGLQSTP